MLLTPARVKGKKMTEAVPTAARTSIRHCFDTENKAINVCRVKKSLSEGALRPSDLLAQFKQIEATTRTQIWAAELLDNTVELIREMVYTHTMGQPNPHGTEQQHNTTHRDDLFIYYSSYFSVYLLYFAFWPLCHKL